jgi:hypothetical protein
MHFSFKWILSFLLLTIAFSLQAQTRKGKALSLALTNSQSAFPFNKFGALFTKELHPGFEVGYEFNWRTAKKHDWFQSFRAGYFYHQFIQHGIPLYTQLGYRFKWKEHWRAHSALGLGYLHSIPDAGVLKLNDEGEYEKAKGIGRPQALINLSFGMQYNLKMNGSRPLAIFLQYQQQLQTPFIKSYVPLLPYNNVGLGVKMPLKSGSL